MHIMKKSAILGLSVGAVATIAAVAKPEPEPISALDDRADLDALADMLTQVLADEANPTLRPDDYVSAADSLGCEVAAIQAVVEVEAGVNQRGLWERGKPLVAFSASLFRSQARKRGIDLDKYAKEYPEVFSAPQIKKYGSYEAAQYARLQQAMAIDSVGAISSAYWGMFQIMGDNWRFCGCESIDEFVERMSTSEREQLDMFVAFLRSTGIDQYLRAHQWAKFARKYNGPSYARRGYHTKLEGAYKKYLASDNS